MSTITRQLVLHVFFEYIIFIVFYVSKTITSLVFSWNSGFENIPFIMDLVEHQELNVQLELRFNEGFPLTCDLNMPYLDRQFLLTGPM